MTLFARTGLTAASIAFCLATADEATAGRSRHAGMAPAYLEECGACHMPYAAEFLSADAWKTLLDHLAEHFDVDAEIDPASREPIRQYLVKHSGHKANFDPGPPKLKITQTRWFRQTHGDVARGHWPKFRTRSNCMACHPGAMEDDFVKLSDPDY